MSTSRPFLARRLALARLALLWEGLWLALWPLLTAGGLTLAVLLSDLLPQLPGWLHGLALVVMAIGLVWAGRTGFRRFHWPTRTDARRRLEATTPHRPLTATQDSLASGTSDPLAQALWAAHFHKMQAAARALPVLRPAPQVVRQDRWGLRVLPLLALTVVGGAAWQDPADRLLRGLSPTLNGPGLGDVTVEAWITPPDYTGLSPLYRHTGGGPATPVSVPEGSRLLVLLQGATFPGVDIEDQSIETVASSGGNHRGEATLTPTSADGATIDIRDHGFTVASWPLTVVPDLPPSVAFSRLPEADPRGRLIVPVMAGDDFGLSALTLRFAMAYQPAQAAELPLSGSRPTSVGEDITIDLTAHRWAGLPVHMHLSATDGKGQETAGPQIDMVLPERPFEHPVARDLIQNRKELVVAARQRQSVASRLDDLARRPGLFDNDPVVFLGLRIAAIRLRYGTPDTNVSSVIDLLWGLALRLEDGGLTRAEDALAQARNALRDALQENAGPDIIRERLDAVRDALQQYMQELARTLPAMEDMNLSAMMDQSLDMQSLDDMLQQMAELTELGARDAAEAMLQRLEKMLDQLRNAQPVPAEAMKQMADMARRMEDLARRQEEMLTETFEQGRADPPPDQGTARPQLSLPPDRAALATGAEMADRQEALRRDLGNIMAELGEKTGQVPDSLGTAEFAMRRAAEALAGQSWSPASSAQAEALAALRDGTRQAVQQMMQAMGQGLSLMPMTGRPGGTDRDPLGRATGGVDENSVKVPTRPEQTRARELMQELRRRSNEPDRTRDERDYLRRLLESF